MKGLDPVDSRPPGRKARRRAERVARARAQLCASITERSSPPPKPPRPELTSEERELIERVNQQLDNIVNPSDVVILTPGDQLHASGKVSVPTDPEAPELIIRTQPRRPRANIGRMWVAAALALALGARCPSGTC